MFTSRCLKLPACSPSLGADGIADVVFLEKKPLGLICAILGSWNCSIRLIESDVDVRFRTAREVDIATCSKVELFPMQSQSTLVGLAHLQIQSCFLRVALQS